MSKRTQLFSWQRSLALAAIICGLRSSGEFAVAQLPSALAELPPLPTNAAQWANSSPLTYEGMKGKGVVFWYF